MAAIVCQALPSFYSDCSEKSLFVDVFNEFYQKYTVTNPRLLGVYQQFFKIYGEL